MGNRANIDYLYNLGKILANPRRLIILNSLIGGSKTVSEISLETTQSHATTSLYLNKMKMAGIVAVKYENNHAYYTIIDKNIASFLSFQQQAR